MNLDVGVVKIIILFIPGILGIYWFTYLFIPKVNWNFAEKTFYSVVLGIISYVADFKDFLLIISTSEQVLTKKITLSFMIKPIGISLGLTTFLCIVNNKCKPLDRILTWLGVNRVLEEKNLLNTIYLDQNLRQYISEYVVIRCKDGNRYYGRMETYTYKEDTLQIFLIHASWYKPKEKEIYMEFLSICLHYRITDISIESIEEV
ncbi:hypothetical protein A2U13_04885 [Fusobacterium necrophorum subsp. funduliforme]|uniref:Uncharacterized protein n=2 Tax=Fusobacterium TaxID=848 RepID=A0AB73C381_9FUSO|nr:MULTISPECIES: hypothetical protein [Fusobacterium]AVQ16340.1 hypothetical protein C4N16_01810 [Fusobacterium gonidiaformans ATCC 25563]KDE64789.1 hypothetical protein FUSO4_07395 [Fusobacterium necrophorum DJ-1]KDE67334.1 hypothetical protein FUSO5_00255 [Fusobacterium necrophorum BFTR-1]KDE72503.1 hypothetical protein FUSO8_05020 [Fusobacterium necrophorum DJ-2]KYM51815.1 hypothetical protein A2U04_10815 [Fusobacterium necrophorum subsp. funduliforme]